MNLHLELSNLPQPKNRCRIVMWVEEKIEDDILVWLARDQAEEESTAIGMAYKKIKST